MKEIFIAFYYVSTFLILYIIGRFFDVTHHFTPYITDSNRLYIFITLSIVALLWIILQNWIRLHHLSAHISSKVIMILTPIVLLSYTFFPISEFEAIDNNDILIIIISIISTTLFYILLGLTHLIFPKKSLETEHISDDFDTKEELVTPEFKVKKVQNLTELVTEEPKKDTTKEIKVIPIEIKSEPILTDSEQPKNTQYHQVNLKIQQLNYQKERLTADTPVNNFVKSYIDKRILQLKTQK